jgi:hypothetical protein
MKHYKDDVKRTEMAEYDSAIATYLVGLTLVEFASEYNKDLVNFTRIGPEKRLPYIGWKTDANRFRTALKSLAVKENPKALELQAIVDKLVLGEMERYAPVVAARLGELERKVQDLRPAAAAAKVFKTAPNAPKIELPPAN